MIENLFEFIFMPPQTYFLKDKITTPSSVTLCTTHAETDFPGVKILYKSSNLSSDKCFDGQNPTTSLPSSI